MRTGLPFFLFFLFLGKTAAQDLSIDFRASWKFRRVGDAKWYTADVPGTVHTDLLANQLIPDPFYRDNEPKVQWIEKSDWEYRAVFEAPAAIRSAKDLHLVFDGLDTYAAVFLNGKLVLNADNMFRQWKIRVYQQLRKGMNELRIIFSSAVKHDDSLSSLNAIRLAGENNRMYSRKAQYQYGWDWGPRLVTCGIWKPVRWETGTTPQRKNAQNKSWNTELVDHPDSAGRAFYFKINGRPVYIRGANWIPCESFLPRAKKRGLYRKLISEARAANINMLRVWGGGVYEDDVFYELCDQYGIMVWQDFMFAGAMYPGDEHFLKNVEEEVRYQVRRLRRHPCIALWCGNNEIDEAWHNWGWQEQYNYSPRDSAKLWDDYQKIFQQLIPGILKELDPGRSYWPSSPSTGWGREAAYKQGDVHYWGVWWGKEPVEQYEEKVGRFNSEYGMQGFPSMHTIRKFSLPADQDTSSLVMRIHQKHPFGYANIRTYIENKFRNPKTFEDLAYVSQLMQADAIGTAVEAHRRSRPYNMGTLFWQLNDCWPVVSWSCLDYYGEKKALYYRLRESYATVMITARMKDGELEVWVVSDSLNDFNGKLKCEAFDMCGKQIPGEVFEMTEQIRGGQSNYFIYPRFKEIRNQYALNEFFIRISLEHPDHEIAEKYFFPASPKEWHLAPARIEKRWIANNKLELTTDTFAYGIFIEVPGGAEPGDNFFPLLPGKKKIIEFSGKFSPEGLKKNTKIRSLIDTY